MNVLLNILLARVLSVRGGGVLWGPGVVPHGGRREGEVAAGVAWGEILRKGVKGEGGAGVLDGGGGVTERERGV